MKPARSLLQGHPYVPAAKQTVEHLRQVFARERKRLAELTKPSAKVRPIKRAAG